MVLLMFRSFAFCHYRAGVTLKRLSKGRGSTSAARLQAVIATAALDEAGQSAWCREQGVYPRELARFM